MKIINNIIMCTCVLFLCLYASTAGAKDYIVTANTKNINLQTFPNIKGGDRILVEAGDRGALTISNLRGESGNPIVIINRGGKVRINGSGSDFPVYIRNCEHVRFTGSGAAKHKYGFEIFGGIKGVNATDKTRYIEIDHIEVHHVNGSGISSKTPGSIRNTWVQYNTYIHHTYVHDVATEGFYIGMKDWALGENSELKGVEISYNIVERTGWDGIQVSSAVADVKVHHNYLKDIGIKAQKGHWFGLLANPGTTGRWYNNTVINSHDSGIYLIGIGGYDIYNNVIVNSGVAGSKGHGINWAVGSNGKVYQNIVVNSYQSAIKTSTSPTGDIQENMLVKWGDLSITDGSSGKVNIYDNYIFASLSGIEFKDPTENDYRVVKEASTESTTGDLAQAYQLFGALDMGAYDISDINFGTFISAPVLTIK